jgi:hypothetical protein
MFVNCIEDAGQINADNKLTRVELYIGKAGSNLAAWADSASSLVNLALESGVPLNSIIASLLGISSDKATRIADIEIKSGPDSLAIGLLKYKRIKLEQSLNALGINNELEQVVNRPRIKNRKYRRNY